jgi:hypothetical protein
VKILTQGGEMLELCYELRTPFVMSIAANQVCDKLSFFFPCVNVYASIFVPIFILCIFWIFRLVWSLPFFLQNNLVVKIVMLHLPPFFF